jgi:hypothetical protein
LITARRREAAGRWSSSRWSCSTRSSWPAASSSSSWTRSSASVARAHRRPHRGSLGLLHGLRQGGHEVEDLARLLGLWRLGELPVFPLRLDDLRHGVGVGVLELRPFEVVAAHRVHQRERTLDLLLGDLHRRRQQLGRVTDLVGPAHRVQNDHVVQDPQQTQAFASRPCVLRDGHLRRPAQRLHQELVRLGRDSAVYLDPDFAGHRFRSAASGFAQCRCRGDRGCGVGRHG